MLLPNCAVGRRKLREQGAILSRPLYESAGAGEALDKSVAEATEQRKQEDAAHQALIASNTASMVVHKFAKTRYCAPRVALVGCKSPEHIAVRVDEGWATISQPSSIASSHWRAGQPSSSARSLTDTTGMRADSCVGCKENTGVIAMIDLLIKDLAMEMIEAEIDDMGAQVECEQMMQDSKAKRTADSKALPAKSCVKADTEAKLQAHGEHHAEGSRAC